MFTNYTILVALIISVLITLNLLPETESASLTNDQYPIVYRRYTRRRPTVTHPTDKYIEDVYEIFNTKAKPLSYIGMTDEEVDRFIFCDFNRHLEECQKYWETRNSIIKPTRKPITTTTRSTTSTTAGSTKPTTTTIEPVTIPHLLDNDDEKINGNEDAIYEVSGEYGDNENNEEEYGETGNDVEENNNEEY